MNTSKLIDGAQAVARNLTYNEPIQGAAKHMLRELCHKLGVRTVRIHKNRDGYMMTSLFGQVRYLTLREVLLWRWFKLPPQGVIVETD